MAENNHVKTRKFLIQRDLCRFSSALVGKAFLPKVNTPRNGKIRWASLSEMVNSSRGMWCNNLVFRDEIIGKQNFFDTRWIRS